MFFWQPSELHSGAFIIIIHYDEFMMLYGILYHWFSNNGVCTTGGAQPLCKGISKMCLENQINSFKTYYNITTLKPFELREQNY